MIDEDDWASAQDEKINRINNLLDEVIANHGKMQRLLKDAFIKYQTERGLEEIEAFLRNIDGQK